MIGYNTSSKLNLCKQICKKTLISTGTVQKRDGLLRTTNKLLVDLRRAWPVGILRLACR